MLREPPQALSLRPAHRPQPALSVVRTLNVAVNPSPLVGVDVVAVVVEVVAVVVVVVDGKAMYFAVLEVCLDIGLVKVVIRLVVVASMVAHMSDSNVWLKGPCEKMALY